MSSPTMLVPVSGGIADDKASAFQELVKSPLILSPKSRRDSRGSYPQGLRINLAVGPLLSADDAKNTFEVKSESSGKVFSPVSPPTSPKNAFDKSSNEGRYREVIKFLDRAELQTSRYGKICKLITRILIKGNIEGKNNREKMSLTLKVGDPECNIIETIFDARQGLIEVCLIKKSHWKDKKNNRAYSKGTMLTISENEIAERKFYRLGTTHKSDVDALTIRCCVAGLSVLKGVKIESEFGKIKYEIDFTLNDKTNLDKVLDKLKEIENSEVSVTDQAKRKRITL